MGIVLLVASILVSLFAGTFPFDFAAPAGSAVEQFRRNFDTRWLPRGVGYSDRVENLLFLMPVGFFAAAVVRPRKNRAVTQVIAGLLVGGALSLTIEVLQAFVGFRDPSLVDVWCNALGATIAAGAYVVVGDKVMSAAGRAVALLQPLAKPWFFASSLALWAIFHLWAPIAMRPASDLGFWDRGMPLLVGNETSGDRGWYGRVGDLALADRAASGDDVRALHDGKSARDVFGESLIAHYALRGPPPFHDDAGPLPPLEWTPATPSESSDANVAFSPTAWLRSTAPVSTAVERISRTSEFTLTCTAGTDKLVQRGPARIVSISAGTGPRNLTIGQDESDAVFRVRTAVHTMPDLYVRDVFANTDMHQLAVKVSNGVIVTYVDGAERGRCQITPEAKVIWRMYPRPNFRLRLEHYGFRSYAVVYRLLVFIPFAVLLGAALITSGLSRWTKRIAAAVAVVVYTVALEIILARQAGYAFQIRNMIISLLVAIGSIALIAWWRRRRGRELVSV